MNVMAKTTARKKRGGFTLIELLIVIAIIAILAVVVIITLNPAEFLAQGRDANRLSDLTTFNSAMNLYTEDAASSNGGSAPLGTVGTTYISIPDPTATTAAGSNCSSLGFPSTGFHCAGPNFYRRTDGTGWIPVNFTNMAMGAPLATLPVDPTNSFASGKYYEYTTDGTNWKLAAVPESQKYSPQIAQFEVGTNQNLLAGFPNAGWVAVPGNSNFGTPNFSVMKYDAVCSDGNGNVVNTPADGNGYNNGGNSVNANNCTASNTRQIASLPGGLPIVDISHTQAVAYCQSVGAHLITNDEYMTIVTNAAGQASNWTGGAVGTGGLYIGNANNASEYPADANDANGYAGESNKTINYTNDERRTLTLSNGSTIWDMSGNVWEHVQRSVNDVGDLTTTMVVPSCTGGGGWNWCQFPNISAWSTDVTQARVAPPNSAWSSSQDIGQVYTDGSGGNQGTTVFIRGDSWNYGSADGAFTLLLSWSTTNTGNTVGFRCAR